MALTIVGPLAHFVKPPTTSLSDSAELHRRHQMTNLEICRRLNNFRFSGHEIREVFREKAPGVREEGSDFALLLHAPRRRFAPVAQNTEEERNIGRQVCHALDTLMAVAAGSEVRRVLSQDSGQRRERGQEEEDEDNTKEELRWMLDVRYPVRTVDHGHKDAPEWLRRME